MILSVHATFGAAVASLVPSHPVAGFVLGFVSHLALDMIPHRDYDLISVESTPEKKMKLIDVEPIIRKARLTRDMLLVSFDAFIGLILAFIFFFNPSHPAIFLLGALGALLPDFLTFLYLILKHKPLGHFFDFHAGIIHSKVILKLNQFTGVFLQFCTVAILIGILFGLKSLLINTNLF
jgi:hypothetical protein